MNDCREAADEWEKARTFLVTTPSGETVPMTLGLLRSDAGTRRFAVRVGERGQIGLLEPAKVGVLLYTTTELLATLFQLNQGEDGG